jgi:hypothetical protein
MGPPQAGSIFRYFKSGSGSGSGLLVEQVNLNPDFKIRNAGGTSQIEVATVISSGFSSGFLY